MRARHSEPRSGVSEGERLVDEQSSGQFDMLLGHVSCSGQHPYGFRHQDRALLQYQSTVRQVVPEVLRWRKVRKLCSLYRRLHTYPSLSLDRGWLPNTFGTYEQRPTAAIQLRIPRRLRLASTSILRNSRNLLGNLLHRF